MKPFAGVEEVLKFANKNVIMTHKHREGVMGILKILRLGKNTS